MSESNRGGRLDPNALDRPDFVTDYIQRAQSQIEFHKQIENVSASIHFDIINSDKIEAVSFIEGGINFIGVSIGALIIFRSIFARILAEPDNLPHVGNPLLEKSFPEATFPHLPMNLQTISESQWPHIGPKDPVRACYAQILANIAFSFLVAHELSHLFNGHVDWINSLLPMNSVVSEVNGKSCNPLSCITRQLLEMDADCGAVRRCLNGVVIERNKLELLTAGIGTSNIEAHELAYGNTERSIYAFLFSVNILFRIFDENYWNNEKLEQRSHPPAPCRQHWIATTVAELFGRGRYGASENLVLEIASNALVDAIKACSRVTGEKPIIDGLMWSFVNPDSGAYLKKLLLHWGEVRPKLEAFSRGGKLAPVQKM